VTSANEARNLISQKGLSINDEPVTDPHARIDLAATSNSHLKLSRGRKRHMRVVVV
jgi:tyrosyl-tRNA synthetase